ncbi:MAG: amidohydrolase family protein [Aureispira sp.]|nr:amidohydrolase family protein [Aureispira sp.]
MKQGHQDFAPLIELKKENVSTLIQNVELFDGISNTTHKNQDIIIANGRIKEIGPTGTLKAKSEKTIDANGMFLMPGLIDSHVHISGSGAMPWKNVKPKLKYNLEAYLYAGITTIYDLGGLAGEMRKTAAKLESGKLAGPSLFHTHIPVTIKDSHPIPLAKLMLPKMLGFLANLVFPTIKKESDAKKIVRSFKKKGVHYMKLACDKIPPGSPEMPSEFLKALVRESHANNLKVFVHIGSVDNALNAVNAGADILAHGIWRDKLKQEEAQQIADSGVKVIYTLAGFVNVDKINRGEFSPSEIDRKMVPCCILDPVAEEKGKDVHKQEVMNEFFQNVSDHQPHWAHNFKLLNDLNVPILVGTDSNLPGTYAGATYYQELYELNKVGLSNLKILQGATYGNATLFIEKPDFGHVSVGAKADLLLFEKSPLEDIQAIENPTYIFKSGKRVNRIR